MDFHRARRFITAALLLLVASAGLAQSRDGNLVEYGFIPAEGDGTRLKIFRDGHVLVVDKTGAWEGRMEKEQIEDLERDLLRFPMLTSTALMHPHRSRPGGVSYIRFRDGDEEVVIAAEGRPQDRDWRTIIERIDADRPTMLIGPPAALLERDAPAWAALQATLVRLRNTPPGATPL